MFSSRLASGLTALGYRPAVVGTAEAFHAALARGPRAAIINLAAHRFDALAAVRAVKADEATRAVPLLGFCGHADTGRRDAARDAGCDAVVTNGAVVTNLAGMLAAVLAGRPQESGGAAE